MGHAPCEEKTFPFFDLPPELREWVYDNLSGDETVIASPTMEAAMSVKDCPLANIMCVSKQIKEEYEHVAEPKMRLIYSDHQDFNFTLPPLPCRLVDVKIVELRMFVVCEHTCPGNATHCEAANDLRQTLGLVAGKLLLTPPDAKVELKLGLWWKEKENRNWPETPHAENVVAELKTRVEEIQQLSRVDIYRSDERCLDAEKIVDSEKLLATWSRDEGWHAGRPQQTEPQEAEAASTEHGGSAT
ncbi:Hypothetical predicted protein [Lecanosticta acicola]|uniref:F-box domain-containing protein n=1 Tax=Lecanosticta acicola TaxID=111012 RepID=A0AAI8Z5C3_9PEZI|nr:Hypothetical predicted protein [Lecanosticta acicola]